MRAGPSGLPELVLSVDHFDEKSIPYPAKARDQSRNHGFRPLKGNVEAALSVPEASDCPALLHALRELNAAPTAFFTVGCEKKFNSAPTGYWAKGYVELAFDDSSLVAYADNYFPVFFHFGRYIASSRPILPVQYSYDIARAAFSDAVPRVGGFTLTIWIETSDLPSEELARQAWEQAVAFQTAFLAQWPRQGEAPIYS